MYTDTQLEEQKVWAEKALFLMRDLLPLMAPVATYLDWTQEERETLGMLLTASARSAESTLLLCAYGQLWDAEVTSRTVCEGSLKFCYLLQNRESFKERYKEYSNDQFWSGLLKDDKKIKELMDVLGNPTSKKWKPYTDRLLSDADQNEISLKFDRTSQRAAEARWGFTGMIREFQKSNDPLLSNLVGLAHGYSISSHIQHADYQGVAIAMDRDMREPERKITAHSAHLVKIISNIFSFFIIRLIGGYRFINHNPEKIQLAQDNISALIKSYGDIYEQWMDVEYPTDQSPQ